MKLNVKNELYVQKNFNWHKIFRKFFATFLMSLSVSTFLFAQSNAFKSLFYQLPSIHTVHISPDNSWKQQYVYDMNNNSTLEILLSFDELFADSRQLYFVVKHYDAFWQPDDMLSIEYWNGFEKQYDCSDYALSFNTTVDYVHYAVHIPIRQFKYSGNFLISVYSIDDDELLLTRPVIIAEHELGIQSNVKKTNDNGNQDLTVSVHSSSSMTSSYLSNNFSICAWQNNDIASMRFFSSPTAIHGDDMSFSDPLVFQGGSEWRWADTRSLRGHVMSDTRVTMSDGYYNAYIPVAQLYLGYSYHEDFNGLQYIHSYDSPNTDFNVTADYSIVHVAFKYPKGMIGKYSNLYIVGDFVDAPFPMERNYISWDNVSDNADFVEYSYFVKQSLANYRIVELNDNGMTNLSNTEASFSETENDYHICAYYRDQSTGYYRLLSYKKHNTLKTPNAFIH